MVVRGCMHRELLLPFQVSDLIFHLLISLIFETCLCWTCLSSYDLTCTDVPTQVQNNKACPMRTLFKLTMLDQTVTLSLIKLIKGNKVGFF